MGLSFLVIFAGEFSLYLDRALANSPKSPLSRLLRVLPQLLATAFFATSAVLGGTRAHLALIPDSEEIMVFFKEPFILFCLICLGWFISRLKPSPSRWEEFKYLASLPLSCRQLYVHFLLLEWTSTLWVPMVITIVLAGLQSVAPWPFLLRLATAVLLCHLLVLLAAHTIHLTWMIRPSEKKNLVYRSDPLISAGAIFIFSLLVLAGLVFPRLLSDGWYWPVITGVVLLMVIIASLNAHLFGVWLQNNNIFRAPMLAKGSYRWTLFGSIAAFRRFNPWLWSNLLRTARRRHNGLLLMTASFILLSYLASMNNRIWSDRADVLLALALIYAGVFAYQNMSQLAGEEASIGHLYALPVVTTSRLASQLIPAAIWLAALDAIFSGLIASYSLHLAGVFFARAFAIGAGMLCLAVASVACSFPDLKRAQRRYLYLLLTAVIGSSLFYRYHLLILAGIILVSLLPLTRINYYKIR
jgi:hypothetical protein